MKIKAFSILLIMALAIFQSSSAERHIISPVEYQKERSETRKSVFLAGSAAFFFFLEFREMLEKDHVVFLDPKNTDLDLICRSTTLKWEIEHIEKADVLLAWIPEGDPSSTRTLSLTTLFELGRFAEMKEKPLIVGISPKHYLFSEIHRQLRVLRPDAVVVVSLEELAERLREKLDH